MKYFERTCLLELVNQSASAKRSEWLFARQSASLKEFASARSFGKLTEWSFAKPIAKNLVFASYLMIASDWVTEIGSYFESSKE